MSPYLSILFKQISEKIHSKMIFLLTADSDALGRFNPSMLSNEQVMELLFVPSDFAKARAQLGGDEDDACTWKGVTCTADTITNITFGSHNFCLCGEVNFQMLPPKLESLVVFNQSLVGEIDTTQLPIGMGKFRVQFCKFTGTIDLGHLPRSLKVLYITYNRITAVAHFGNLPTGMEKLHISELNIAHKALHIGRLPAGLPIVELTGCGFTGVTYEDKSDAERVRL